MPEAQRTQGIESKTCLNLSARIVQNWFLWYCLALSASTLLFCITGQLLEPELYWWKAQPKCISCFWEMPTYRKDIFYDFEFSPFSEFWSKHSFDFRLNLCHYCHYPANPARKLKKFFTAPLIKVIKVMKGWNQSAFAAFDRNSVFSKWRLSLHWMRILWPLFILKIANLHSSE